MQRPMQGDWQGINQTGLAKCPSLTEVHGKNKIGPVEGHCKCLQHQSQTRM